MSTRAKLVYRNKLWHSILKSRYYLFVTLCFVEFLIAGSGQAIESEAALITSHGEISYNTHSTKPTATPSQKVESIHLSSKNLTPILGTWGAYNLYGDIYYGDRSNPQIAHADFAVTYNGKPSIRLGARNEYNLWREVNGKWIAVQPGDRVIMSCWIKTEFSTNQFRGGIFGFDVYGPSNRILEVTPRTPQSAIWNIVNNIPKEGGTVTYVPYGSDWTQVTIDVTIPYTTYTHDDYGKTIKPQQITGLIPWLGGNWFKSDGSTIETANIWFADAELYINP